MFYVPYSEREKGKREGMMGGAPQSRPSCLTHGWMPQELCWGMGRGRTMAGTTPASDLLHVPQTKSGVGSRVEACRVATIRVPCGDGDEERPATWIVLGNTWWEACRGGHTGGAHKSGYRGANFEGKHTLLAFLDYSKCYERAGRKLARDRAVQMAPQPRGSRCLAQS